MAEMLYYRKDGEMDFRLLPYEAKALRDIADRRGMSYESVLVQALRLYDSLDREPLPVGGCMGDE